MITSRLLWAGWALVPVAAVTYHFGPGQSQYALDRTAGLQDLAMASQVAAQAAQELAYAKHLEALEARRAALIDSTPTREAVAVDLTKEEDALYRTAATKWEKTAEDYGTVLAQIGSDSEDAARDIRWAKAHATVRSGDVWGGISDLESLMEEVDALGDSTDGAKRSKRQAARDAALIQASREELATAYYYGARLLRLSGMPPQEWRIESGKARQHFRYLAETDGPAPEGIHQRNLELVLNLEQTPLADLQGKPLPKESPGNGSCKQGNRKGTKPGRGPKPPSGKKDARGAGGAGDITDGW